MDEQRLGAVIDRFEGSKAILLLDEGRRRLVVARHSLPEGAKAGDWLRVALRDDALVSAGLDEEATARAKQEVDAILERLRRSSGAVVDQ